MHTLACACVARISRQKQVAYRGTSPIRNSVPLGPYRGTLLQGTLGTRQASEDSLLLPGCQGNTGVPRS